MRLTPDDIAARSFTPSADGYHQGEVRSFLERVAGHVRSLQSALSEGSNGTAAVAADVHDRESRLTELEGKLGELVADLAIATDNIRGAQAAPNLGVVIPAAAASTATDQQAGVQLQAERQALSELQASLRAQHESLVAQQNSLTEQQQAFLAKQETFDAQQQAFVLKQETLQVQQQSLSEQQQAFTLSQDALAEQQRTFTASQAALAEQQRSLSEQQEMLGEHLDDTRKLASSQPKAADVATAANTPGAAESAATAGSPGIIPRPLAAPASTRLAPATPAPPSPAPIAQPATGVVAAANEAESLSSLFASDLDDQPLFSDSANDLLDGVLDDVMGTITDEGTSL